MKPRDFDGPLREMETPNDRRAFLQTPLKPFRVTVNSPGFKV